MKALNYQEALKKVQTEKVRESFVVITIGYGTKLLLPYKEGMELLNSLSKAELFVDEYGKPKKIAEFARDTLSIHVMPFGEYARYKIAALLNISPDEVLAIEDRGLAEPA